MQFLPKCRSLTVFLPKFSAIKQSIDPCSVRGYLFSSKKLSMDGWKARMELHSQLLQNRKQFEAYMTDQRLLDFVQQHYFLSDIVQIAGQIVYGRAQYNQPVTDCQAIFLAFTHNLFQDRTQHNSQLLPLILQSLGNKLSARSYNFQSEQVQKHYMQQMLYLTYRDSTPPAQHAELVTKYYKLGACKFGVYGLKKQEIDDKTVGRLWELLGYLPMQRRGVVEFMDDLQQLVLQVLGYEGLRLGRQRQQGVPQRELLNEGIDRFSKLAELCMRLGNSRGGKFINVFKYLPYRFSNQDCFADYVLVLREFVTPYLLKKINFKEMDAYHGKLSESNRAFNTGRGYSNFQSYGESLVCLNVYNFYAFSAYFQTDGKTYDPNAAKGRK